MKPVAGRRAVRFEVVFMLATPLRVMTGKGNDVADDLLDMTPDNRFHINGYVWSSFMRHLLLRLNCGQSWAKSIGKYPEGERNGISPLWTRACIVDLPDVDLRTGIRIDRALGSVVTGGLYSKEAAPAGMHLFFCGTWFAPENSQDQWYEEWKSVFSNALWVADQGIENIGGGWSYGFGRLKFVSGRCELIDLEDPAGRLRLFSDAPVPRESGEALSLPNRSPDIAMPWRRITVRIKIADGQILAIHTRQPDADSLGPGRHLPDAFVFRGTFFHPETNRLTHEAVVTGKSLRQALFSREIERIFRAGGESVCEGGFKQKNRKCGCPMCRMFGSTDASGLISVMDARITSGLNENKNDPLELLYRISLCEHSMQNMNLLSGEYLTGGEFETEILIDYSRDPDGRDPEMLYKNVLAILDSMQRRKGPEGWYRIGATSTCTGQLECIDYNIETHGSLP